MALAAAVATIGGVTGTFCGSGSNPTAAVVAIRGGAFVLAPAAAGATFGGVTGTSSSSSCEMKFRQTLGMFSRARALYQRSERLSCKFAGLNMCPPRMKETEEPALSVRRELGVGWRISGARVFYSFSGL